jgi:hypothetical protein
VVHHPTVIAAVAEGRRWRYEGDADVKSKFWGRSIELRPEGLMRLSFADGDVYQWNKVTTSINNLILGKIYIDHGGIMKVWVCVWVGGWVGVFVCVGGGAPARRGSCVSCLWLFELLNGWGTAAGVRLLQGRGRCLQRHKHASAALGCTRFGRLDAVLQGSGAGRL